jgi:hypothetical protein
MKDLLWSVPIIFGLVVISFYASKTSPAKFLSLCGVAMLIAGASFGVGGLLGFLFGIPISLQQQTTNSSGENSSGIESQLVAKPLERKYRVNTHLEEISDWLTKILLGVGLTQIPEILKFLKKYSEFASPSLGGEPGGKVFAVSILIYFLLCGFIAAYMWTRLYLSRIFIEADKSLENKVAIQKRKISTLFQLYMNNLYISKNVTEEQIGELSCVGKEDDWIQIKAINDKVVAMYRYYEKGTVLAFGHDFLLDDVEEKEEKEKEECKNATKEGIKVIFDEILNHENNKNRVIVSTGHRERFTISKKSPYKLKDFKRSLGDLGYSIEEIQKPINESELKKGDILIVGNAWGDFNDTEINAVKKFVSRGGSLFVIGAGCSWGSPNCNHSNADYRVDITEQDKENIWTYPMNKLVKPYEMLFTANQINSNNDKPTFHSALKVSHPDNFEVK